MLAYILDDDANDLIPIPQVTKLTMFVVVEGIVVFVMKLLFNPATVTSIAMFLAKRFVGIVVVGFAEVTCFTAHFTPHSLGIFFFLLVIYVSPVAVAIAILTLHMPPTARPIPITLTLLTPVVLQLDKLDPRSPE